MKRLVIALLTVFLLLPLSVVTAKDTVSIVSKETVKTWMDTGIVTILDVRQVRDWTASEFKIASAVRVDPNNITAWKNRFPKDRKLVLYCA